MKDIKGFTLVELLAVITVIGLLGIIALEAIESVNKGNKEKAEEIQRHNILTAAIAYVPTSKIDLPNAVIGTTGCEEHLYTAHNEHTPGNVICEVNISLAFLAREGIIDAEIENPLTGEYIDGNSSYVRIQYVISTSSIAEARRDLGKFDGNYFYELVYGG